VIVRGKEVSLAPKEFCLLQVLMEYPDKVWSREELLDKVWGRTFKRDSNTLDVHIHSLCQKIERDAKQPEYLITVKPFGYQLR
jgi:two-component system phosphate regulon response regulator PhoB